MNIHGPCVQRYLITGNQCISLSLGNQRSLSTSSTAPPPLYRKSSIERVHEGGTGRVNAQQMKNDDGLGPMPDNWELDFTSDGTPYYMEYVTHYKSVTIISLI